MECSSMGLQDFFPKELEITAIEETENSVSIRLKSRSEHCVCPRCGKELSRRRATYNRKAQDLPMIGKAVLLTVNVYEYQCEECNRPAAESFDGFLKPGSRLTERCEDFIARLALESSCEGASRVLKELGVAYSGDSIIRLLLKRLKSRPATEVGSIIGVDDFAYKKRRSYGTVIVDETTRKPVALLDGRDGTSLREWLRHNQHVKVITRDRASEYAKAIQEELPDAIQVADRFHLHENLLQAIKKALNSEIPGAVAAEGAKEREEDWTEEVKKKRSRRKTPQHAP